MERAIVKIWTSDAPVFKTNKKYLEKFVSELGTNALASVSNIKDVKLDSLPYRLVGHDLVREIKNSLSIETDSPPVISVLVLGTADILTQGREGAYNTFNVLKTLALENKNYPNHGLIIFGIFPLLGTPESPLDSFGTDACFLNDLLEAAINKIRQSSDPLNWKIAYEHPCSWFVHKDLTLMDDAFESDGVNLKSGAIRHLLTRIFISAQVMSETLINTSRISNKLGPEFTPNFEEIDLKLETLIKEMLNTETNADSTGDATAETE